MGPFELVNARLAMTPTARIFSGCCGESIPLNCTCHTKPVFTAPAWAVMKRTFCAIPDTTLYTKFRNGNRNLHFVHVANDRKGPYLPRLS